MVRKIVPSLQPTYELLTRALQNEAVFVTGPPSSGKTTLVKKAFDEDFKDIFVSAYIDCYAVSTPAKLYQTICQSFSSIINIDKATRAQARLPEIGEPVNMSDVPRIMNQYKKLGQSKGFQKFFVIFDHVEIFERTNLVDCFVALCREVSQDLIPLRLVVISYEEPADIVQMIVQKSIPIALSFQDRVQVVSCNVWSKQDVIDWILELPPDSEKLHDIYAKFVRTVVTLIYQSDGRDPRKVRMYCQQNFGIYLDYHKKKTQEHIRKFYGMDPSEPIEDAVCEDWTLGSHIETTVIQSFITSHMPMQDKKRRHMVWTSKCPELRIHLNTAILIVAGYIAAYTRPADDKLNFGNNQKRKSKAKGVSSINNALVNRPFTLERLMQIYISLMQKSVGERNLHLIFNSDCALGDIERLENVNILQHQSGWDLSSEARYKLAPSVKRNYVERLAQHAQLDLDWFRGL